MSQSEAGKRNDMFVSVPELGKHGQTSRAAAPIAFSQATSFQLGLLLFASDFLAYSTLASQYASDAFLLSIVSVCLAIHFLVSLLLGTYTVRCSGRIIVVLARSLIATSVLVVVSAALLHTSNTLVVSRVDLNSVLLCSLCLVMFRLIVMVIVERFAVRLCEHVIVVGRADAVRAMVRVGEINDVRVKISGAVIVGAGSIDTPMLGRIQPRSMGPCTWNFSRDHHQTILKGVDRMVILDRGLLPDEISVALKWLDALSPEVYILTTTGFPLSNPMIAGGPLFHLLRCSRLSWRELLFKRSFDIVFSLTLLMIMLPLMMLIGIAVRLESPGPALFRQQRLGYNNIPFTMLKFRTMRIGQNDGRQAIRGDVRLTRVGGFLRRTSLDEIPQFLNVLGGSMSLVGPRPHPLWLNDRFEPLIENYASRHSVLPGITGWAQANGARGETPTVDHMRVRIKLDLDYIKRRSTSLDLVILVRTFKSIFLRSDVY